MKRFIFLLALHVSLSFCIRAQTYTPLNLDTTCFWVNHCHVYFNGPKCESSITSYIEKDTVLNAIPYFKLVSYFNSYSISQDCLFYIGYIQTPHFIREDTVAKKVWMYDGLNPEICLVDFNLNQNDTLHLCNADFAIDSTAIDTISNIPRRLQYYHTLLGGGNTFTIEGIGNSENFPFCGYGEWQTPYFSLQYYCKNGHQLYPDNVGSCTKPTPLSIGQIGDQYFDFKFTSNVLTLQNLDGPTQLNVWTSTGQQLYEEVIHQENYRKDFSQLCAPGVYILWIKDATKHQALKIAIR